MLKYWNLGFEEFENFIFVMNNAYIIHVNNLCACLHFCKRKVLLIMFLQVYIKGSAY